MNFKEIWDAICDHWPEGGLGGGGLLLILIAFKLCKGAVRWVLVLISLGLIAGAVVWFIHRRH